MLDSGSHTFRQQVIRGSAADNNNTFSSHFEA
jgi:hypothetical protein